MLRHSRLDLKRALLLLAAPRSFFTRHTQSVKLVAPNLKGAYISVN